MLEKHIKKILKKRTETLKRKKTEKTAKKKVIMPQTRSGKSYNRSDTESDEHYSTEESDHEEHKRRWIDRFPDDSSYESAIQYLKHRMYVLEDMIIIQDKRRLNQLAYSLYEYRNQIIDD